MIEKNKVFTSNVFKLRTFKNLLCLRIEIKVIIGKLIDLKTI